MNIVKKIDVNVITRLVKKYSDLYAMYIEYPHKSFWSDNFKDEEYRNALKNLNILKKDIPLLLYVHIPFCQKQCFYCTCHTFVTNDYGCVKNYLNYLYREIDLLHNIFDKYSITPNFREIHLGGGSPTMLHEEEFNQLLKKLKTIANIKKLSEFAIEIDPRAVTIDMLRYYHSKGINRISFGIQDFDLNVQRSINRIQPQKLVEDLLTSEIREYFHGINFDIMWGLPRQTKESFKKTINSVIGLSPDRVSLLKLHYAPDIKRHQRLMNKSDFPGEREKISIFHETIQTLENNGYMRIGLEHFTKPTDDLAKALKDKTLHWNSLGYTVGRYSDIIGLGSGSASTITSEYYFQNVYPLADYETDITKGKFPIYRGYKLNNDDIIRRDVIHNLRTYFSVDFDEIEKRYDIDYQEYFNKEITMLDEFIKDGLLNISEKMIVLTELGKHFTAQVCRVFDKYAKRK
ncbi:MAG: oxygen-independent coproporphyrinogen III oxidase [Elusimicrobia bacterium]|nr:oxygen-independent coproporphyrinogen III oxidase [Elusimicrobiota bacterium]